MLASTPKQTSKIIHHCLLHLYDYEVVVVVIASFLLANTIITMIVFLFNTIIQWNLIVANFLLQKLPPLGAWSK